jgi:hypothetical protein
MLLKWSTRAEGLIFLLGNPALSSVKSRQQYRKDAKRTRGTS